VTFLQPSITWLLEIIYPLLVIKNPDPDAAGTTSLLPVIILGFFVLGSVFFTIFFVSLSLK